jgi:ABC-2 type transport system permease protein
MVGLVLVSAAFYPAVRKQPSLDDLMRNLPQSVKGLFGAGGDISFSSPAGYLQGRMFTSLVPILLLIFAIALGARALAGAEDDGSLELLLANPISRRRVAAERYAGLVALVAALGAVTLVSVLVLAPPFGLAHGIPLVRLAGATLAATCLALLHASLAFAAGAFIPGRVRAISTATSIAVGGYIVFGLVAGGVVSWLRFISPWWWYMSRNIFAAGLPPEAVVVPLGLSGALAVAGIWGFTRRDLR